MTGTYARIATSGDPSDVIRVPDDSEVLEFSGYVIGQSSTAGPRKFRWVEITLFRVTDGTSRYVLHRVGQSRVFHKIDGCNRGVPTAALDLRADAVPCMECYPPVRAVAVSVPNLRVSYETAHHGAVVCADAAEVLRRLRMRDPIETAAGRSVIGSNYSAPAQRLLDEARTNDADIDAALTVVRKL
jgi:hypothetical protein